MSTEELLDSLVRVLTEQNKNKRNIIAYLFLWISIVKNIPIREAFRRYSWIEFPNNKSIITQTEIDTFSGIRTFIDLPGVSITLVPRNGVCENEMPFTEAALELAQLFKEILKIRDGKQE